MSEQLEVLKQVAGRLNGAGIAYMISGSIALSFYAEPRLTRDIDVVVELKEKDVRRITDLFGTDYYLDTDTVRDAIVNRGMFNIIHLASVMKVDFIVRKDTPYRREEFDRRHEVKIDGVPLSFVSAEDLILSKLVWAADSRSEIQLLDVRNLITTVPTLDWSYMNRWAVELAIADLLKEVRR